MIVEFVLTTNQETTIQRIAMVETQSESQPRAVPFISFDMATQKFILNPEAFSIIQQIEGAVGLCAVAGMYRTGKSYLLNRILLDRSDGFNVGPTINPCTKGLWLWSEPVQGTQPNGEPISVLVIDTEGLGAFDETQNHDVKIFTLAILLSSFFMFNSMGNIDEAALTQLSLVVNLTKNIQLKDQDAEMDPEEYQTIFPNFLWVVRDFALQLTDEDGLAIKPKDYLEQALKEQRGNSDSIEQKNRIRRLLKAFFKDRDCCTMVRPLSDERQLQNLAKKPITDLREEFQDQVKMLRKKVLDKMKPKMLQGRQLSGSMIVNLAKQYVEAINNGAVPNIQNAWTYVCIDQCQMAIESSAALFTSLFNQKAKMPCTEALLLSVIKEGKKAALKHFKSKAIGTETQEFKVKLIEKLSALISSAVAQNRQKSEQAQIEFLRNAFHPVEVSLSKGHFETIAQFNDCIGEFVVFVDQNSPKICEQTQARVTKDFLAEAILTAAQLFFDAVTSHQTTQTLLAEERLKMKESSLQEIKSSLTEQLDLCRTQLKTAETENSNIRGHEQHLLETITELKRQRSALETKYDSEVKAAHDKLKALMDQQESQLATKQEQALESQRQMVQAQSELSKQTALFEQKIQFMDLQAAELRQKLTLTVAEAKENAKQHSETLRETSQQLQKEISDLRAQLDEQEERSADQLSLAQQDYNHLKNSLGKLEKENRDLRQQLDQSRELVEQLRSQIENDTTQDKLEALQKKLFAAQDALQQCESEMRQTMTQEQERNSLKVGALEKELAISQQKVEFQKVQNQQLQDQLKERATAQQTILQALQDKAEEQAAAKEEALDELASLKLCHAQALKDVSFTSEQMRAHHAQEVAELKATIQELKEAQAAQVKDFAQQTKQMQDTFSECERLKQENEKALIELEANYQQKQAQLISSHQAEVTHLEHDLAQVQAQAEQNARSLQSHSETTLANLQQVYQEERSRSEKRLSETIDTWRKKLTQAEEEYQEQLEQMQAQHELECEEVSEAMRQQEAHLCSVVERMQVEAGKLQHSLQQCQQEHADEKARLQQEVKAATARYETITSESLKDQELRFGEISKNLANKEALVEQLTSKNNSQQALISDLQNCLAEQSQKHQVEVENQQAKLAEAQSSLQSLQDSSLRQKLDDAQTIALYKQRCEFQESQLGDLQTQVNKFQCTYEKQLREQKLAFQKEMQDAVQAQSQTVQHLQAKLHQKKLKWREAESRMAQEVQQLRKEKESCLNELNMAQMEKQATEEDRQADCHQYLQQIQTAQEQLANERQLSYKEIDRLKAALNALEREHCDLQSASERDKALLEGKCQFLEQQRDTAKSDYAEACNKFERTIGQIQKRGAREFTDSHQAALIAQLELQIQKSLQEMHDSESQLKSEHQIQMALLQKQLNDASGQLQIQKAECQIIQKRLDGALNDLKVKDRELRQAQMHQQSEDSHSQSYTRQLEQARDGQRERIEDMEQQARDNQHERAMWTIEKERLGTVNAELHDVIAHLQRRCDSLLQENDRLKYKKSHSFLMKQGGTSMRSPSRQSSLIEQEQQPRSQKSIFVGGMSRALMQPQTQSQLESESFAQTLEFSSELATRTEASRADASTSGMQKSINKTKAGNGARKNVINFNVSRAKPTLNNITNLMTPGRAVAEVNNGHN